MARRRRPAAETKEEILVVAKKLMAARGPAELRLDEVAAEIGISRQAVLHHFGSREGLLREVVGRAWLGLFSELSTLGQAGSPDELIDRVDEVARRKGNARLGAWLLLSEQGLPEEVFEGALGDLPAHMSPDVGLTEARYRLLLVGATLFGDAVFGTRLRQAVGLPDTEEDRKDFHRWLAAQMR